MVYGNVVRLVGKAGFSFESNTLVVFPTITALPFPHHRIFPDDSHTPFPFHTELHQQFLLFLFCLISLALGPEINLLGVSDIYLTRSFFRN